MNKQLRIRLRRTVNEMYFKKIYKRTNQRTIKDKLGFCYGLD